MPHDQTAAVADFVGRIESLARQDGGEFPTDKAAMTLAPKLPFMLSITPADMDAFARQRGLKPEDCDIYPLFALSSVLYQHEECRRYVQHHFHVIQHPDLKLTWAYLFLLQSQETPEMRKYVKEMLNSKPVSKWATGLANDLGWTAITNRLYRGK